MQRLARWLQRSMGKPVAVWVEDLEWLRELAATIPHPTARMNVVDLVIYILETSRTGK